jgi:hypothetical protein
MRQIQYFGLANTVFCDYYFRTLQSQTAESCYYYDKMFLPRNPIILLKN